LRALANTELGLWLTHQLGIDLALTHGDDGFTVRLLAGTITSRPAPAPAACHKT
jgi:hypothetical protein